MNLIKAALLALTLIAIILSGCNVNIPKEIIPDSFEEKFLEADTPNPVPNDSRKRFTSSAPEDSNFENIRGWAEKYKDIKDQNVQLRKRNDELVVDNKRLMDRFESMNSNLELTEKELTDANEMLIEMRKELDNWKMNVLGFREESNYVHKEQLKALVKILKLLGAEFDDADQK